jgi:hypothetical protein
LSDHYTIIGDVIDRWNSNLFSPKETFSSIFQFLFDHWKDIEQRVKTSLSNKNLILVGHHLISPKRLFFRLTEDLSPFMYEIPRYYGHVEPFLLAIGVKESPSPYDYILFLNQLSYECQLSPLNPNELRAVITIIYAIANQKDNLDFNVLKKTFLQSNLSKLSENNHDILSNLLIPDENSILRKAKNCILNDDNKLRSRIGSRLVDYDYYFCHPYIHVSVLSVLKIPSLSTIIFEQIEDTISMESLRCESTLTLERKLNNDIKSYEFISTVTSLLSNVKLTNTSTTSDIDFSIKVDLDVNTDTDKSKISDNGSSAMIKSASQSTMPGIDITDHVVKLLNSINLSFVTRLPTSFILNDSRRKYVQKLELNDNQNDLKSIFYINHSTESLILYIDHSAIIPPITIELGICLGICKMFSLHLSHAATLACLLAATDLGGGASKRILDNLNVSNSSESID